MKKLSWLLVLTMILSLLQTSTQAALSHAAADGLSVSSAPALTSIDLLLTDEDLEITESREPLLGSPCIDDYRKVRNYYAVMAGIAPFVGLAGMTASAVLAFAWEYAGWHALKAALGPFAPAAGVFVQHIVPGVILVGFIAYETAMIAKFVQASRAYRLVKDLHGIGDGKMLALLNRRLQERGSELGAEAVYERLLQADQTGALCDRTWVTGRRGRSSSERPMKRVAYLKDMERVLLR